MRISDWSSDVCSSDLRIENVTTCNTLPCPRWCILGLKQFQFLADLPLKIVDSANVNVMERLVWDFLPPVSAHSADCSPSPIIWSWINRIDAPVFRDPFLGR